VRGCLFIILLGAIVAAFVVVVGLPAVAAGVLTAGLSAAGLVADDTTVTVSSSPPTDLVGLRADTVRVTATDATFRGMEIGSLDLALGDVSILDRTAASVDGELREVTIRPAGGREIDVERITVLGTPASVSTTSTVRNAEAEALIADAVEAETGIRPTAVRLEAPDRLRVEVAGAGVTGRLAVTEAGNLVVRVTDGPLDGTQAVLVRGGEDLPIELTGVRITESGDLRLTGDLSFGLLG
jgi:hypothetical protein